MKTRFCFALGAALITLLGCTRGALQPRSSNASPAAADATKACETTSQNSEEARALVGRYCTGCHSPSGDAGDEHDFTRPELLRAQHRSISARLRAHSMPPRTSRQPTPAERALLTRWADCGALQTTENVCERFRSIASGYFVN